MSDSSLRTWLRVGAAVGLLILTAIVVVLTLYRPEDLVFAPRCPWFLATGVRCPGCGLTRGFSSLLQGDLRTAVGHNVLIFIVPPLFLFVAWLLGSFTLRGRLPRVPEAPAYVGWLVFFALSLFWLYRIVVDLQAS